MIMKPVGVPSVPKVFPKCSQGNGCTTVPLFPTPYRGEQGTGTPKGTTSPPRCSQAQVFPMTRRVKVTGDLFHGQVPDGAVYVGRAAPGLPRSPYANPFTVKTDGLAEFTAALPTCTRSTLLATWARFRADGRGATGSRHRLSWLLQW
jgi:hypothetical protein